MLRTSLSLATTLICTGLSAQGWVHYEIYGDALHDQLGQSVSGAGDVDNDGFDDFIVGAFRDETTNSNSGSASVYSGQTGALLYTFIGDSLGDYFGWAVSGAGDVNNDGHDDLIVGAKYDDNGGNASGSARVFSGKTGAVLYTVHGTAADENHGQCVSGAGDVNGDGYDDFIVGNNYSGPIPEETERGGALVYSGKNGSVLYAFYGVGAFDWFGHDVSDAGDVNGDGFDDFVVGAYADDLSDATYGQVTVFSGQTGAVLHKFDGDLPNDGLGESVSGAGDVDGDGFDDIIAGAYGYDDDFTYNCGSATVFSGNTGAKLYTFYGDARSDEFGRAVSGAGDVDGDGFDDLIVGTPYADYNGADRGMARVFSGRTGGVLRTFYGDFAGDHFGTSVSEAGDVNGDGFDNVIVGAPWHDKNGTSSGVAKVLSAHYETLHSFHGDSGNDYFGVSVSGAGDVNADGYDDLIVGAPGDINDDVRSGSARVFSGRTGSILYTFTGDSTRDEFGRSVSGAGDVDGDGFGDIIVGAWLGDDNGAESGRAMVFSGRTGAVLYTFIGDSASDGFGESVSNAGDVNADGFDDLIVGATGDDNNGLSSGSARVFSGRTGTVLYTFNGDSASDYFGCSVSGAGDVDNDGFDDLVVGAFRDDNNGSGSGSARVFSGRTGAVLYTFNGDSSSDAFGGSVSDAGDVDRDGFDDLIVGARYGPYNGIGTGSARVFSGQNGNALHTFYGDSANDGLGNSVSGAGDVNGDGYADLIVGAHMDDNLGTESGSARLYCGKTGSVLQTFDGEADNVYFGSSVSSAGDIDGDNFYDVIVGAVVAISIHTPGEAKVFSLDLIGTPPRMRIFGKACMGSNGHLPHIDHRGRLAIGESIDFLLRGALPTTTCALVLAPPTQQDLGAILPGLPGCMQYAKLDYLWAWTITDVYGMASLTNVNIPNNPGLLGWQLNAQWGCLDVSANPFGATTSNGLEMVVGS